MRVRRCCVANCGCRRLRGDYGKELYKFPKGLWDSYAAASGQGGGKLSFEPLPPKPEWQYVCLCASAYAKVLHKLYGKSVVDGEDATAKNVFVNVCKSLDKCGYRDGDPDGPATRAICKDALAAQVEVHRAHADAPARGHDPAVQFNSSGRRDAGALHADIWTAPGALVDVFGRRRSQRRPPRRYPDAA